MKPGGNLKNLVLGFVALALVAAIVVERQMADDDSPRTVLLANQLIPKGTSGTLIRSRNMFALTTFPRREVQDGAISDPLELRSRVAAVDIYPGHQLTVTNLTE
jgi:hypothetical protein